MIARFCMALFWGGLGTFLGFYLGIGFSGRQIRKAWAREVAAVQARDATEARLLACQFPVRKGKR